ncbi:hypothetical protein E2C01_014709 [Portunus trituberculatus]|uniref:Uncharacterized protein n=1 Tax=Portunus trituberculatus TaxID=210409 RepID=A0A5B7DKN9_PORTR|nr:hypothetical protein [Portunus trituberculatus]
MIVFQVIAAADKNKAQSSIAHSVTMNPLAPAVSPLALIVARRQVKSLLLTDSSVTDARQDKVMRAGCEATSTLGGDWGSMDSCTSISSQGVSIMPSSLVTCACVATTMLLRCCTGCVVLLCSRTVFIFFENGTNYIDNFAPFGQCSCCKNVLWIMVTDSNLGVTLPDLGTVSGIACCLLHRVACNGPVCHQVSPLVLHHHNIDILHAVVLQCLQVTPNLAVNGNGPGVVMHAGGWRAVAQTASQLKAAVRVCVRSVQHM